MTLCGVLECVEWVTVKGLIPRKSASTTKQALVCFGFFSAREHIPPWFLLNKKLGIIENIHNLISFGNTTFFLCPLPTPSNPKIHYTSFQKMLYKTHHSISYWNKEEEKHKHTDRSCGLWAQLWWNQEPSAWWRWQLSILRSSFPQVRAPRARGHQSIRGPGSCDDSQESPAGRASSCIVFLAAALKLLRFPLITPTSVFSMKFKERCLFYCYHFGIILCPLFP